MEMLSLYDYLGRAGGKELGAQVTKAATIRGIKLETRYVSNPAYTGDVMLYPKPFLDEYFKEIQEKNMASLYEDDDDDLPF